MLVREKIENLKNKRKNTNPKTATDKIVMNFFLGNSLGVPVMQE